MGKTVSIFVLICWAGLAVTFMVLYPNLTPAEQPIYEGGFIVGTILTVGTIIMAQLKLPGDSD